MPDAAPADRLDEGRRLASSSRSTTRPSRRSRLAREAGERGATAPAVYNAANEVCVEAFHGRAVAVHRHRAHGCAPWLRATTYPRGSNSTVDDVLAADAWAREEARLTIGPTIAQPATENLVTALFYTLGVLIFVVAILASIGLHEFGHLIPAKKFGGKVTQWFVGFGPTVFSRRIGETEYGVKAIPLGGYVKIVGMLPPGKGEETGGRRERRDLGSGSPTPACSPS